MATPDAAAATTTTSTSSSNNNLNVNDDLATLLTRVEEYLGRPATGHDRDGEEYESLQALWTEAGILAPVAPPPITTTIRSKKKPQPPPTPATTTPTAGATTWYTHAFAYWEEEENCPPTVDGVLGGFGHVSDTDVVGSQRFLETRVRPLLPSLRFGRVVDCGAGIGRVTKHLLLPLFAQVDLLEQSPRLIAAAPEYIFGDDDEEDEEEEDEGNPEEQEKETAKDTSASASASAAASKKAREEETKRVTYICAGMQDFAPAPETLYDVVWIQWCIGHLHDLDLIRFLRRCQGCLRPGSGVVIVKDNCCDGVDFVVDKDDSSLTRSAPYLKALFKIAGFELCVEEQQKGFPTELYPVVMFCFKVGGSGEGGEKEEAAGGKKEEDDDKMAN